MCLEGWGGLPDPQKALRFQVDQRLPWDQKLGMGQAAYSQNLSVLAALSPWGSVPCCSKANCSWRSQKWLKDGLWAWGCVIAQLVIKDKKPLYFKRRIWLTNRKMQNIKSVLVTSEVGNKKPFNFSHTLLRACRQGLNDNFWPDCTSVDHWTPHKPSTECICFA